MHFETMTDDELKRFLLLGTQDKCAALAMQEAVRRWLKGMDSDELEDALEDAREAGHAAGYIEGELDAKAEI